MSDEITVEIVFALPDTQLLKTLTVQCNSELADAVAASGVLDSFSQNAIGDLSFGIWGQVVARDYRLKDGDRIEIYRPLRIDPREARRKLAEAGRTMGNNRSD